MNYPQEYIKPYGNEGKKSEQVEEMFDNITKSNNDRKVMFITGIYPNGKVMYYAIDLAE